MNNEDWDDGYDESWERMREEAHIFMKNKEESAIKKWLNQISYKDPVGYFLNISNREIEIFTKRPGCLIGKAGTHIEKLKAILKEEFSGEWKVKFVEVRGGFVQI